jgi:DNA-binding transcriptional MerR regulator/effector-binding domain-containing protein
MYTIGSFSKINTVTPKTLRLYDEMGLLKPAEIDHFTGYRYYSTEQLPRMHRILALKSLGFSLSEIKTVIEDDGTIEMLLESKLRETSEVIKEEKIRLLTIRGYLEGLKGDIAMNQDVIIKALPGGTIYSKRMTIPNYDAYFDVIPKIGEEVLKANPDLKCAVPEYCFIIYHDMEYKEKDIDVEYCEMVTKTGTDTETIKFKKLDPVETAACILHKGPYGTLSVSYGKLHRWLETSGYESIGPDRESYIDGIWNKEDPEEWLTEIQVPVKVK